MGVLDTTRGGPLDPHPEEGETIEETSHPPEEDEPTTGDVFDRSITSSHGLRIVDRKLEAAKVLFSAAHGLEDALDAIGTAFHPDLEPAFLEGGWDDELAERLRVEMLGLHLTATALVDAALQDELTRDESKWISLAIRRRIREER